MSVTVRKSLELSTVHASRIPAISLAEICSRSWDTSLSLSIVLFVFRTMCSLNFEMAMSSVLTISIADCKVSFTSLISALRVFSVTFSLLRVKSAGVNVLLSRSLLYALKSRSGFPLFSIGITGNGSRLSGPCGKNMSVISGPTVSRVTTAVVSLVTLALPLSATFLALLGRAFPVAPPILLSSLILQSAQTVSSRLLV